MSNVNGEKEKIDYSKLSIDKQSFDNRVCFNDEFHKYFEKGQEPNFASVTTIIHSFAQEFDAEFWSRYKALQKLVGQDAFDGPVIKKGTAKTPEKRGPASEAKKALLANKVYNHVWTKSFNIEECDLEDCATEIRKSYDDERETSCFRGTTIHKNLENLMTSKAETNMKVLGLDDKIPGKFRFNSDTKELIPGNIYPEILLYRISDDGKLRVAGQVDLLIVDHDGGVIIVDFKTNKKLDKKSYFNPTTKQSTKMKYPLNNIDDCNFMHYSLQLSLYFWLANKLNFDLFLKGLYIIHYDHDGNVNNHECEYLKDDVERMLAFHKKQLENEQNKALRKKMVF